LKQLLVAYGGGFTPRQDYNVNCRIIPFNDGPGFAFVYGFIHCPERLAKTLAYDTFDPISAYGMPVHLPRDRHA